MKAKQVVILTPIATSKMAEASRRQGSESSNGSGSHDSKENEVDSEGNKKGKFGKKEEILLDAQTIFKYNIIKKKNPKVNVVTELISEKNIAFLLDDPLLYSIMKTYDYD